MMRDGSTHIVKRSSEEGGFEQFATRFRARVVALSGAAMGSEFPVDCARLTIGRGPGVAVAFDNQTMSRQHAAIDFCDGGFRISDLGSTNGISVNGNPVKACEIRHGDRFEIGGQEFQLVVEEQEDEPDTYELPESI
jgi:predicted component of type VI protein secretion system